MRKAISGVLVVAMMMSTFGASNVQAASNNSGSNYVEDNGVIVEASNTDADTEETVEDNKDENEKTSTLDNIEGLTNVDPSKYEYLYEDEPIQTVIPSKGEVITYENEERGSADRIHYINLYSSPNTDTSDAILIESNGHYGLIDASNRWQPTVPSDSGISGHSYQASSASASGERVMEYLSSIGVDHLDFVLVTHAHSDHLGGVPNLIHDVAGLKIDDVTNSTFEVKEEYFNEKDEEIKDEDIISLISEEAQEDKPGTPTTTGVSLIDEKTTYIYKDYNYNSVEDALLKWNNKEYYDDALKAMSSADKLEVSSHSFGKNLLNAVYSANGSDTYDDTVSFKFWDFNISLYNLNKRSNTDENANSIVAYVEKAGTKTVLLADMDLYDNLENKIGNAIVAQHGKINVMKVAHHGNTKVLYPNYSYYTPASTSKSLIDTLGVKYAILCTNNTTASKYAPFYGYMKQKGIQVYRTMDSTGNAIVQDMTNGFSLKTGSINVGSEDKLVMTITDSHQIETKTVKYYGIKATNEMKAYKNFSETETVTRIKTIYQKNYLSLSGAPSQWIMSGQNDWAEWYKDANKYDWVYVNSDGTHKKGWQQIYSSPRGKSYTYYFGTDGIMKMGWTTIGGKRAYLRTADNSNGPQGSLATGWEKINGTWYYFNADGKGHEGWMQNNADWYYIDNGLMYTGGLRNISGVNYFFGSDGKMKTGWQSSGGSSYYFDSNGKAHSGWLQSNNKWYYTESSGKMVTSQWIDNYWIGSNGVWSYQYKGSWKLNSKGWWYEDASGWYPKSCWQKINGELYYFGSDGYMAANEWIDGKWINGSGYSGRYKYTGSWKSNSKGWWFTDTSGWYPVNKWQKINGKWYYFEGDGYMASNKYIDGYWVNSSGACE